LAGFGFVIALRNACCCRWMALVHQPATVFAQDNMMLRGDPRMASLDGC
jgi:hypothetical protein